MIAEDPMGPILAIARREIADAGWTTASVYPVPGSKIVPFTYSVGFTRLGLPEVVILGMPDTIARSLLMVVWTRIGEGAPPAAGQRTDILTNAPVRFRAIDPSTRDYPLEVAHRIYAPVPHPTTAQSAPGRAVRALQLVWPDLDGRFPDDARWGHRLPQPLLPEGLS